MELMKLVDDANGKMYSIKSGQVVTDWDRMESELATGWTSTSST